MGTALVGLAGVGDGPKGSVPLSDLRLFWNLRVPANKVPKRIQILPPKYAKVCDVAPNVASLRDGQVLEIHQHITYVQPHEAELSINKGRSWRSVPWHRLIKPQLSREAIGAIKSHAPGFVVNAGEPPRNGNKSGIDNCPRDEVPATRGLDAGAGRKKALAYTNNARRSGAEGPRNKVCQDVAGLVP